MKRKCNCPEGFVCLCGVQEIIQDTDVTCYVCPGDNCECGFTQAQYVERERQIDALNDEDEEE